MRMVVGELARAEEHEAVLDVPVVTVHGGEQRGAAAVGPDLQVRGAGAQTGVTDVGGVQLDHGPSGPGRVLAIVSTQAPALVNRVSLGAGRSRG